jgi:hypothetical protein
MNGGNTIEVLHDEPRFGIAVCRNLALAVWRDAPQVEWFQAIRDVSWPQDPGRN